MAWSDSSSRVSGFLASLGAATVALALVAQASDFAPDAFLPTAVLVLAVVLFLGLTAFFRLCQINIEDALLAGAMNRIRAGYLRLAPDAARYLSTTGHDDVAGVFESLTLGMVGPVGGSPFLHLFVTAPATVAVIDGVLGGLTAGSIALLAGAGPLWATLVSLIAGLLLFGGLMAWMMRGWIRVQASMTPRFPSPASTEPSR
jgi:hypothetical protein